MPLSRRAHGIGIALAVVAIVVPLSCTAAAAAAAATATNARTVAPRELAPRTLRSLRGMRSLPSGTVTFLFTDVEGSTRLLQEHGAGYAQLVADHRRTLRDVFGRHEGVEVDTQGDSLFVAFARATDAVAAAGDAQDALGAGPVQVHRNPHRRADRHRRGLRRNRRPPRRARDERGERRPGRRLGADALVPRRRARADRSRPAPAEDPRTPREALPARGTRILAASVAR